ncbi:MAG: D-aminoacyl-tRNA deacylase [Catonella sp.]|uniref:D-aminoacyl-tRNA deacylase n=1 Tax=Catonella sp. TaxID=2382125 RepID=UPI003F9FF735
MRFVIQVVENSDVKIDGKVRGAIGRGYMVLIGVGKDDTKEAADKMIKKLIGLRIMADENGKTNLSINDMNGELLLISQFTLYADTSHGNRPGFTTCGAPDMAKELYHYIIDECKKKVKKVEQGEFGADMKVTLTNDGPFTIILDSADLK